MGKKWEKETLVRYLNLYYSDGVDWGKHLESLRSKGTPEQVKKKIAFCILGSYVHKIKPTDQPERLLFGGYKFGEAYEDTDWVQEFNALLEEDERIEQTRNSLLTSTGCISPIEYHSRSRQAFIWMTDEAKYDPRITKENRDDIYQKLKNVIYVYGPTAICSLFQKNDLRAQYIDTIHSWATGYFLERNLHACFGKDLLTMKALDMERAPQELIKTFRQEPTTNE